MHATDIGRFGIRDERKLDATARFEQDVDLTLAALAPLRHALDAWLELRGAGRRARDAVILATHEAVANAIQHSGTRTPIRVRGDAGSGRLTLEISDDGVWRIPDDPPSHDRGRGLNLIRTLVSDPVVSTDAGGTTVRFYHLP